MSRRVVAGVAVAGLTLAACSSSGESGSDTGAPRTEPSLILPTTTTSTVPPPTTTTAPTTTSTTTTTTTTAAPTTTEPAPDQPTTTTGPSLQDLVLTTNGIGSAQFGADPDGVIGFLTSFLGPLTGDTGWVDPFEIGPCSGNELRQVSWGSLTLTFGDVSTVVQGRRHFFAYAYGVDGQIGVAPIGLETDRGIGVGSRVIDVLGAYPGVVLNPEDDFVAPNFYVNDSLRGFLTGLADDDTVTVILGGIGCGE